MQINYKIQPIQFSILIFRINFKKQQLVNNPQIFKILNSKIQKQMKDTTHLFLLLSLFCLTFSLSFDHKDGDSRYCLYTPGTGLDTSFYYRITHQWHGEGKSLALNQNDNVQFVNSANSDNQLWRFFSVPNCDGWYYISNKQVFGLRMYKILQSIGNNLQMVWKQNRNLDKTQWRVFNDATNKWIKFQESPYPYRANQKKDRSITMIFDGKNNNKFQLRNKGNFTGQNWKLTPVKNIDDSLADYDEGRGQPALYQVIQRHQ